MSTVVYEARLLEKWPESSAAASLAGEDPAKSSLRAEDLFLRQSWQVVSVQWADTLKARKTADSLAAVRAVRRQ